MKRQAALVTFVCCAWTALASAQIPAQVGQTPVPSLAPMLKRVTPAVAALLQADDPELVALAEATLWRVWSRSGDPAVDALFAEGLRAMEAQDWLGAVAAFGRVIERAPSFAEGWNKRATARYLATHYAMSIADCEEVVRLNPYHFGALSGQGLCHTAVSMRRRTV